MNGFERLCSQLGQIIFNHRLWNSSQAAVSHQTPNEKENSLKLGEMVTGWLLLPQFGIKQSLGIIPIRK